MLIQLEQTAMYLHKKNELKTSDICKRLLKEEN